MRFRAKWTENELLHIRIGGAAGGHKFYGFYGMYLTPKEAKDLQKLISARLAGKKQKV